MTFRRFARGADPHRAGCIRVRSGARGLPLARKSMESCELPVRELGGRTRMRRAAVTMTALALLAGAGASVSRTGPGPTAACSPAPAGWGTGSSMSFANWGNPGSVVDYDDNRAVGGALVGRKFELDGTRLRIELDATFGYLSARSARSRRARRGPTSDGSRRRASASRSAPRRCSPPPAWRRPGSTGPSPTSTSDRTCRTGSIPTPSTTARRNSAG